MRKGRRKKSLLLLLSFFLSFAAAFKNFLLPFLFLSSFPAKKDLLKKKREPLRLRKGGTHTKKRERGLLELNSFDSLLLLFWGEWEGKTNSGAVYWKCLCFNSQLQHIGTAVAVWHLRKRSFLQWRWKWKENILYNILRKWRNRRVKKRWFFNPLLSPISFFSSPPFGTDSHCFCLFFTLPLFATYLRYITVYTVEGGQRGLQWLSLRSWQWD